MELLIKRDPSTDYQSINHCTSLNGSTELSSTGELSAKDVETSASKDNSFKFRSLSRGKKWTIITFCIANACAYCFYAIIIPFFPTEASAKGASTSVIGLIFGVFQLVVFLMSPILGKYITHIGAKFMYVSGVMVSGSTAVLFGFLDQSPDGTIYIVMCFLVRIVEACGVAAINTASVAITFNTFPEHAITMIGILEMFVGIGALVGPPLGGALFQLGGFVAPFATVGCMTLLVGFVGVFVLPPQHTVQPSTGSIFFLLRIPVICLTGLCLMTGTASMGFVFISLSIYLKQQFHLSPAMVGLVFLSGPGVYALATPLWGWLVDRKPKYNKVVVCVGYTVSGLSFYLMGPAPFLPIPYVLASVQICSVMSVVTQPS